MNANMTVANVSRTLSGIGQRLREIRLERGIGLRELARKLELSPSAVSKIARTASFSGAASPAIVITDRLCDASEE